MSLMKLVAMPNMLGIGRSEFLSYRYLRLPSDSTVQRRSSRLCDDIMHKHHEVFVCTMPLLVVCEHGARRTVYVSLHVIDVNAELNSYRLAFKRRSLRVCEGANHLESKSLL
jgi:hypothetical protein